jgi:8-oxo-dGTP pyrophosphatase MutT (NUDIX family)
MHEPSRVEQFAQELNQWDFSDGVHQVDQLDQLKLHREYSDLITADHNALARERVQGHFTSSALMVDPMRAQVMLVMHPRVKRWLQLGGHIESTDRSFREAALRECQEESGFAQIDVGEFPVRLDRHEVVCKSPSGEVIHSVHWDVQFLALIDSEQVRKITEDAETRWWGLDESIPGLDHSVELLIGAARAFLE